MNLIKKRGFNRDFSKLIFNSRVALTRFFEYLPLKDSLLIIALVFSFCLSERKVNYFETSK